MSRPRDSQRSRLYEAETKAYVATYGMPTTHGEGMLTVEETTAYVRAIERTRWWRNRYRLGGQERHPVTLKFPRKEMGGAWAQRRTGTVCLAPWARRPHVILHELAHLLTPDEFAAHGPEYARTFVAMARRFEPDLAANLKTEFKAGRVKTRAPAKVRDGN